MSRGKDPSGDEADKNSRNFLLNLSRDESEEMDGSESLYFHADTNALSPSSNNEEDDDGNHRYVEEARTPPRVQSSHSLFGEEIMQSARLSATSSVGGAGGSSSVGYLAPRIRDDYDDEYDSDNDCTMQYHKSPHVEDHEDHGEGEDLMFSPDLSLSPKSEVTTPPSTAQPPSLSPPPLHYESYSQQSSPRNNNHRRNRPPRAPNTRHGGGGSSSVGPPIMLPSRPQQQQPAPSHNPHLPPSRHVRAWSHGDSSYLSALTDASSLGGGEQHGQQLPTTMMNHSSSSSVPSFPAPPRHHHHQRNASWDPASNSSGAAVGVLDGMNIDISSLQQPILDDDDDDDDAGILDGMDDILHQPVLDDDVDLVSHQQEPTLEKEVHPVIVREAIRRAEAKVLGQFDRNKQHDEEELEKEKNHPQFHGRLASRICEFETEAETQIFKAIEEEMEQKNKNELVDDLVLPDIPESDVADDLEHEGMRKEPAAAAFTRGGNDKKRSSHIQKQSELARSVIRFAALQKALSDTMTMHESFVDIKDPCKEVPRNAGEEIGTDTARLMNIMKAHGSFRSKSAESKRASQNEKTFVDDSNTEGTVLDAAEMGKSFVRDGVNHTSKLGLKDVGRRAEERRSDWRLFGEFLKPRKANLFNRLKLFLAVMIPAIITAAGLFYGSENSPTRSKGEKEYRDPDRASASWRILFLCVRHPIVVGTFWLHC